MSISLSRSPKADRGRNAEKLELRICTPGFHTYSNYCMTVKHVNNRKDLIKND